MKVPPVGGGTKDPQAHPPAYTQTTPIESEHFAVLQAALAVHDRLQTSASHGPRRHAQRSYEAVIAGERPSLRLIDGGHEAK